MTFEEMNAALDAACVAVVGHTMPQRSRSPVTAAEAESFKAAFAAGVIPKVIAGRSGRATVTVRAHLRRLGAFAAASEARDDVIRGLWADGLTSGAIAARLGMTQQGVLYRAKRLGLPQRPAGNPNWRKGGPL